MKLFDDVIHIEVQDLLDCGFTRTYIDKATSTGNSTLPYKKLGGKKLFVYSDLGKRYREAILHHFGEPLEYLRKMPIKDKVKYNMQADHHLSTLNKKGIYSFSEEWILKNTWAASWLDMIVKYGNKQAAKLEFNMTVDNFITSVCDLLKTEEIALPYSPGRLKKKVRQYKKTGYDALIHGLTGKTGNAAKINDEESEAVLLSLIEHPNQYDDVAVCFLYNQWAALNGYKELDTSETVGLWRRKKEPEITIGRYGNNRMNEKYIRQVKGFKPTAPGFLWESDDNNLDFLFANDEPGAENKLYNRYVSYVVADSYCGLVLGKSYRLASSPVVEMAKLAYIDAMYYVRCLTGGWYLPFEVKTDHWQNKSMFPFLESIGNFVPPAHFNKHRGYIEQLFGSPHFKRCQKFGANNYNGNNITARNAGVNVEALKLNEKQRPLIGNEAEHQIEEFFYRLRNMPDISRANMKAVSKQEQWLNKWNTLTNEQKRPISDEQFLRIFGIKHQPQGRSITITNRGIEPQISGIKYSYDLPSYVDDMPLINQNVNVIYDPYDMSRVLISNGNDIRFIAKSATLQPRALQDTYAGSRQMLNMILAEKKEQVTRTSEKKAKRQKLANDSYDPSMIRLAPFMPKELKNSVEDHYISHSSNGSFEEEREAYIDAQFNDVEEWD